MDGNKNMNVRRVNAFFAILIASVMVLAIPVTVLADSEPNNDFSDAEYTYDGYTEIGNVDYNTDQYDYYKIYLFSGDTLTATLDTSVLDLRLYDSGETFLEDANTNNLGNSYIEYTSTSMEYYYIEVRAYVSDVDYELEIEVTDQQSGAGTGGTYVGGDEYVPNSPLAELPTLNVGDSAYFGGIKDLGEEYTAQIDEALEEFEDMGFDIKYDISGGIGAYMGWEVASNNAVINGNTCYDITLMGAVAINLGLEGSVDGDMDLGEYGGKVSVDGSANGFIELEATLDGHLYLTVDEMAIAKLTLTVKVDGKMELHADVKASMQGMNYVMKADATGSIDGAQIDFTLQFDPPLDVFQYGTGSGSTKGIYQGKEWYVPAEDTEVSGSINAQGTISYDIDMEMTDEDPVKEKETINLATEIGNNAYSEEIPGGEPEYTYGEGGVLFTCTYASGNIFVIETEMGEAFGMLDMGDIGLPGTRQFDSLLDPESMMPDAGMQLDSNKGMITGMTVDGTAMTNEVPKTDVEAFVESPLEDVTSETGGRSAGLGGLLLILGIVIVIVVVVVVVVIIATKKKAPPQSYGPQPYDPNYQQGYQQPPPPPQQYPPQDQQQYQQYPPPPQPPQY